MKGLELSRMHWEACSCRLLSAAESLEQGLSARLSAGLAGEGSQCFGYDDELSQDHDFGPDFCVWMNDADYAAYGSALQKVYTGFAADCDGFTRSSILAPERFGVMGVSVFFNRLTGFPKTDTDWLFLSESALACAVNGEIWKDGCRELAEMRRLLMQYYPEDVRRKKIAARAAVMAQAGQYNLLRSLKRGDLISAQLAASHFTEASISMVHLLCRRYTPFYKWAFRSLTDLSVPLAELTVRELEKLQELWILKGENMHREAFRITETICAAAAAELLQQGLSHCESTFLQDHLPDIMEGIHSPQIRAMSPMMDPAF